VVAGWWCCATTPGPCSWRVTGPVISYPSPRGSRRSCRPFFVERQTRAATPDAAAARAVAAAEHLPSSDTGRAELRAAVIRQMSRLTRVLQGTSTSSCNKYVIFTANMAENSTAIEWLPRVDVDRLPLANCRSRACGTQASVWQCSGRRYREHWKFVVERVGS
jgi:hypothetical protein